MKKYLISTITLFSVLILSMDSYAQPAGGMGMGQRQGGGMGQMRGRGNFGMRGGMLNVEAVNAAIAEIETQLTALKEAMEGAEPMNFGRGMGGQQGAGQVDMQAIMQQMQERQAKVQAAANSISEQILILDSTPLQTEITELQAAVNQANEEEAEETSALIQAMIDARQETAQRLGIRIRGARGNRGMGQRGGGRGGINELDADLDWTLPTESPGMGQAMASLEPDADGFISMFNGTDLTGWDGLENYWSVKDGAIQVVETPEQNVQACLVWMDSVENPEKYDNFELHVSFRWLSRSGNSGVQFRGIMDNEQTKHIAGYQPDLDGSNSYNGALYDERSANGRHSSPVGGPHMGPRGYKITYPADGGAGIAEPLEDSPQELAEIVNASGSGQWNDMTILADGPRIVISINGHVMSEVIDEYPTARKDGLIGFQQHAGQPMILQFKDVKIKFLDD